LRPRRPATPTAAIAPCNTGCDHYADGFEILAPHGPLLGTRRLLHPHVDEQPFTRSLSDVSIPGGITEVLVHACESVHEYDGS
jgi:hypothetical protein